ncbi:hypothetical protein L9F63_024058 [Diploptera punctata]|uniref:Uncharacterized protein n=1 Tax=Diploptera punctata TaxID=6984 RepID=A0AAD8E8F3_DIPPU|nr:hypothetical protein L9F63_024058 [Diploptera punctata]
MMQQDRLLDLALDAVGDQLVHVCLRLLNLSRNDKTAALKLCNSLQETYHSMIPYTLANEVAEKLLDRVDSLSSRIRQYSKEPWKEEILQNLVSAIIHPAVTVIELSSSPEHIFPFGIKLNFLVPLVYSRLYSLNNLKVLRLGRSQCDQWFVNSINVSKTLEELTFIHNCNDKVLAQLPALCKYLKRVNVRDSRQVTDASVETFLSMRNLEQLNIVGTRISEAGLTKLLQGLSDRECTDSKEIKSFGCSYITYNQLNSLVNKLPNLMEIQLSKLCCIRFIATGNSEEFT